jgi:hypothetical protein
VVGGSGYSTGPLLHGENEMTKFFLLVFVLTATVASASTGTGRWKGDGNGGCYWDANDDGPDQCDPNAPVHGGRWKVDGNHNCYWEPNDDGPNQCEQRAAFEEVQTITTAMSASMADVCNDVDDQDQEKKLKCGEFLSGLTGVSAFVAVLLEADPAVLAATGGAAAYCAIADLVYGFQNWVENIQRDNQPTFTSSPDQPVPDWVYNVKIFLMEQMYLAFITLSVVF